jgi:hypothetical protein
MSRGLKPGKLYDDYKSNINLLTGLVNPLFVEDPPSWSWGDDHQHGKESDINAKNIIYITPQRADSFNVTATKLV